MGSEHLSVTDINRSAEPVPDFKEEAFAGVQSLSEGLFTVDRENRITFMNPAAQELTGWDLKDALGMPSGIVFRVVNALTREASWQPIAPAMRDNRRYTLLPNTILIRKDLSEMPVDDTVSPIRDLRGQVVGAVITFRDVGTARVLLERVLEQVHRDPLTTLPDRTLLEDRFDRWKHSTTEGTAIAMLYLDLDEFKQINDTLGHVAGDFVLQTMAHRFRAATPETGICCRLGGDEFIVMLEQLRGTELVAEHVDQLQRSTLEPILLGDTSIQITLSLGVARSTDKEISLRELLADADKDMYRAKHARQRLLAEH